MTQTEMTYPNAPGFKERGGTSQEAAVATKDRAPTLRQRCLAALERYGPSTPDEVAGYVESSILAIRPRMSELLAERKVHRTQGRRANASGHTATVYAAGPGTQEDWS